MSRFDAVGLFWQEYAKEPTKGTNRGPVNRPLAPVPEPNWFCPEGFPELGAAGALVIDLETEDPGIGRGDGPGDIRGDGKIVGIGVGTDTGERWYYPLFHTVCPEQNHPNPDAVLQWAAQELTRPGQLKVGANLLYDLFWLQAYGIHVPGPYIDVQWVEAIINETARSKSLDALGERYCNEGKESNALYEWCARSYGGNPNGRQRANIYRAPPSLVGPYAESDVDLPWRVWQAQKPVMEALGVTELVDMEHRLIPMLLAMRKRGVKVNADKANRLQDRLAGEEQKLQRDLNHAAGGGEVNVNSGADLARVFDRQGVEYPTTSTGRPSFTKEFLEGCDHPMADAVLAVRRMAKARGTFVQGYLLDSAHEGRIHALFHPLRTDEHGAISGRFSSSNPNLQNLPSRDPYLAPLIRGCFEPDTVQWRRGDYDQGEYRMLAHYARGPKSDWVRERYNLYPDSTDFHDTAQELVQDVTGIQLGRKPTKNINFGLTFGMGKNKLIRSLGVDQTRGEELYGAYHRGLPFVKRTFDMAMNTASTRGYVKTLLGRVAVFDLWEPADFELRQVVQAHPDRDYVVDMVQKSIEAARAAGERIPRPGVTRAFTHKALNRVLQGSLADYMKKAMVDLWEAGICDALGAPLIQVHDELNWDDPCTAESAEAFAEAQRIMVRAVPKLRVPMSVSWETGPDWGNVK